MLHFAWILTAQSIMYEQKTPVLQFFQFCTVHVHWHTYCTLHVRPYFITKHTVRGNAFSGNYVGAVLMNNLININVVGGTGRFIHKNNQLIALQPRMLLTFLVI